MKMGVTISKTDCQNFVSQKMDRAGCSNGHLTALAMERSTRRQAASWTLLALSTHSLSLLDRSGKPYVNFSCSAASPTWNAKVNIPTHGTLDVAGRQGFAFRRGEVNLYDGYF